MIDGRVKYYTYKLDMRVLNVLAILMFLLISCLVYLIERNDEYVIVNSGWLFFLMIVWMVFHEILHGIGFSIFPEVDSKNVVFGMALEKGVFYCMCKQVVHKKVILVSLMFPLVFIGFGTLFWGMIINHYVLVVLSIVNIVGAVGDIVMAIYFFRIGEVRYLDLDDCTSFTVLSDHDLSECRSLGILLIDSGVYDEKMVACDKKRIRISRESCYILLIYFILIIMLLYS